MRFQLNKSLFGGIFTLFTGTEAAQLIAILLQPFLRRMFLPEDFGAYSVYLSLVSILVTLSTLRYEPAIVQPEKKGDAVNLFFLAFYFNLIFSFFLMLIIGFFRNPLASFLNISRAQAWWLVFLPASVFLLGTYQTMNYYLIRKKRFKAISLNKGARRLTEGGVQLGLGALGRPAGLVLGDVAGHVANVTSGLFQLKEAGFKAGLHSFPLQRRLMRQYSDYPLYSMLPMALNTFCLMIPAVFINKFYSQEVAGYFDLTRLVLVVPSALLTMSVGQVFLQEVSEKKRKGASFFGEYKQLLGVLSLLGLIFALVMTLLGPWMLGIYAGAPYQESGRYGQILVWGTLARVAVSPLTMVYVGLRKLKAQAAWQITYFALVCSLVFFRNLPVRQFILILTGVEVLAYGINLVLIHGIVKQYHQEIPKGESGEGQASQEQ